MSTLEGLGYFKMLLIIVVSGYLGLVAFALVFANRLVFPAPQASYKDSKDILKLSYNNKGDKVSMVFLEKPGSQYLIYYHHGNGEDLGHVLPRLEALRQAGFSVLAWDYPGYGTSDGKPSESVVNKVALQIWQTIPEQYGFPHDKVILYGRSLGGGPVVYLARKSSPAGIIMEGTFTSIFRVGLPVKLLPWDIFDNLKSISAINCPSLFIHGTNDRTVPFKHALKLYDKAPQPKFFTWVDEGTHNSLIEAYPDVYFSSINQFREFLTAK